MTTIQATRLTSWPAGSPDQGADAKEAVYRILAQILPGPGVPGAACAGVQGGLWDEIRDVPARGAAEDPHERAQRLLTAQAICRTCPAIEQCRERRFAIPGRLPGGIWAGQLYLEGCTEPRAIVCAYCPAPIPDVLRRGRSTTCGGEDCARKAAVAAKRKARPPTWSSCGGMSTCRRCATELAPQRSDAHWRTREAARRLCKPCYGHLNNTGGLADYERVNRSRDDLLDDYVVLREQGYDWRQCAELLGMNYRTFETAMYRARRDGDPRAARAGERGYLAAGAA